MTSGPRLPSRWTLADLVDLETLLEREQDGSAPDWRGDWSARHPELAAAPSTLPRRTLFHTWLRFRQERSDTPLPGTAVASGWRWLGTLALVGGLLLGGSVTGGLLHYQGTEPVNVAWFLAATLGVQWLLLLGGLTAAIVRKLSGVLTDFHPVRQLVSSLAWLCSAGVRRLPGEQRERVRARLASWERKRELYGSLAAWPVLSVTQLFAVGYNTGILAVLLAHVAATDLAFGWQSTLDLSPHAVHILITSAAAPWSWFAANPHPTLTEIELSRFAYAQGITGLDRNALASWWPFLAYAVATYGLLPRTLLLALAHGCLRHALNRWSFDHEGCNALLRRLTGPMVHAQEGIATLAIPDFPPASHAALPPRHAGIALLATDLEIDNDQASRLVTITTGLTPIQVVPLQIDHPSGNTDVLQAVAQLTPADASLIVLAPAHRAPIRAIALVLRRLLDAAGNRREVILLLVGRHTADTFSTVPDQEFQHWRNLLAIHRLPLTLQRAPASP